MFKKNGQVKLVYDNIINECKKSYSNEGKTSTAARSGKTGTRSTTISTTIKTTTIKTTATTTTTDTRTNIETFCRTKNNNKINYHDNAVNVGPWIRHQSTRLAIKQYMRAMFIMMILLTLSQLHLKTVNCYEMTILSLSAATPSQDNKWPHMSSTIINKKIMPSHAHAMEYHKNGHMTTVLKNKLKTAFNGELVKNSIDISNNDEIISSSSSSGSKSISGSDILSREIFLPTVTGNELNMTEILAQQQHEIGFDDIMTNAKIVDHKSILTEAVGDTTSSSITTDKQKKRQAKLLYKIKKDINVISADDNDKKIVKNTEKILMPNHDHMGPWHKLFKQLNPPKIYDEITGESDTDNNRNLVNNNDHQSVFKIIDNNYYNNDVENDSQLIDVEPKKKPFISDEDNQKLLKLVIDGLGLKNLPDMSKVS